VSPLDLSKLAAAPGIEVPQARTGAMPTAGRWGWYRDHEGREFRRVSTLIKKVETDTYYLDQWKLRQVAEGLAIRDDLVFAVKAMGRPDPGKGGWTREQKRELDRIAKDAAAAAKQRDGAKVGTGFHTLTERVDRGEPIETVTAGLPAAAAQTIRAYAALRELNGWRTVEIERTVVLDELEVAGTLDRIELVPGLAAMLGPGGCQHHAAHGTEGPHFGVDLSTATLDELPVIVDVKTEESPWLNGLHIGPQLGIYSRALKMWRPTGGTSTISTGAAEIQVTNGEYVPAACVRQDVAIVVHLRDGKATPYFVNLTEGWGAAQAAYAQMERESRAKRKLGAAGCWFAAVPNIVQPPVLQTFIDTAVAADYANPARPASPEAVAAMQPVEFQAVRGADGMVRWEPEPAAAPDTWAIDVQKADALAELKTLLIEQIWKTMTVDGLAILWNMAADRGVPWSGPVQMAGDARRRQIECGQRALHVGTGKCACGWVAGVPG